MPTERTSLTRPASYTPTSDGGAPPEQPRGRRTRLFRWRGILPLAIVLGGMAAWWSLFGERVVQGTVVEASRDLLGTQVDIASLRIDYARASLTIRGLQIADPSDRTRNLLDADAILLELEPRPLFERKVVVRRLAIRGASHGRRRAVPARPVEGGGFAPSALAAMRGWTDQFDVPLLSLTPIDTIRSIILDPTQLATVRQALELRARADSVRGAVEQGWRAVRLEETLDSSRALVRRLSSASPLALGVDGTRRAIVDAREGIRELEAAKLRVEALEQTLRAGTTRLAIDARGLDDAARADHAFARGLLRLPSFDAPEIGSALFGKVSLERFEQALYWTEVAEQYVPPGLRPRASAGPPRARSRGATVSYPKAEALPRLLVRHADMELLLDDGARASRYGLQLTNATLEPALVAEPMRFAMRRLSGPPDGLRLSADGMIDRRRGRRREEASVTAAGIAIAPWSLPGLPLRLEPRAATMQLRFAHEADRIAARWHVVSDSAHWLPDSSRTRRLNDLEGVIVRVLSGIRQLELTAELDGERRRPALRVRSNLDRVIAERVRAVVGEEVARAEARARAAVDRIVERETAPIRAHVAEVQRDAERRVADARERIDLERAALESRLRAFGGGLIGG